MTHLARAPAPLLVVPLCARLSPQAPPPFDFGRTMRVDYFHTGGPTSGETLALDRVVNDGAWAGSRTQLIDATNLGKYFFDVRDKASGRVIYSRGFASIYGEWETTAEVEDRCTGAFTSRCGSRGRPNPFASRSRSARQTTGSRRSGRPTSIRRRAS